MDGGIVDRVGWLAIEREAASGRKALHAGEVAVEGLGCGKARQLAFAQLEGVMQEAARAGGVDYKACCDMDWDPVAPAAEM